MGAWDSEGQTVIKLGPRVRLGVGTVINLGVKSSTEKTVQTVIKA